MIRILSFLAALTLLACSSTQSATTARTTPNACTALGELASGDAFGAPLTVVEAKRTYRYEGRARLPVPTGVAIRVRTEPGMAVPDVHRVVACRMQRGPETSIGVTPRGGTFEVRVKSHSPEVARELQRELAPTR
jgi:hypothetical protein